MQGGSGAPLLTFQSPNDAQDHGVCDDVFNNSGVIEENEHLHNAA